MFEPSITKTGFPSEFTGQTENHITGFQSCRPSVRAHIMTGPHHGACFDESN